MEAGPAPQLHHLQAVLDRLSPEPARAHTLRCSGSATGCPIGTARGVSSSLAMPLISTRRPVLRA
jgi:hypothetical protein